MDCSHVILIDRLKIDNGRNYRDRGREDGIFSAKLTASQINLVHSRSPPRDKDMCFKDDTRMYDLKYCQQWIIQLWSLC